MKVLDLFSGIGGFTLGLERAGFKTQAFCEIDPFCQKVLKKHWPEVPIYDDIRTLTAEQLKSDGICIDAICGGFPCTDISVGGRKAGIDGEQSGLWREYFRLIRELRPHFALMENVGALAFRGLERVLADLTSVGFDAEWQTVSASAIGAPHARDRVWIIAYPERQGLSRFEQVWESVCREPRASSTEFGNKIVPCGAGWPLLGEYLRMGDGVSRPVDRIRALGNAVVPAIPYLMGQAITAAREASLLRKSGLG